MNTKRFLCAALGAVCYFAFLQAQVRTEKKKKNLAFWPDSIRKTKIHGWISNQSIDLLGGKC